MIASRHRPGGQGRPQGGIRGYGDGDSSLTQSQVAILDQRADPSRPLLSLGERSGSVVDDPELVDDSTGTGAHFIVTVYDNDKNTFDQVILILMAATSCGLEEAQMETWEVHHLGKSVVHHGDKHECQAAAAIISQIGIKVTVTAE